MSSYEPSTASTRLEDERDLVTYRIEISADEDGSELGRADQGDFPDTLAALVENAEA
jgi:hypothetical protein